jgi:hypothetical protein
VRSIRRNATTIRLSAGTAILAVTGGMLGLAPAAAGSVTTGPVISQILTAPGPLSPGLLREHIAALLRAWQ